MCFFFLSCLSTGIQLQNGLTCHSLERQLEKQGRRYFLQDGGNFGNNFGTLGLISGYHDRYCVTSRDVTSFQLNVRHLGLNFVSIPIPSASIATV